MRTHPALGGAVEPVGSRPLEGPTSAWRSPRRVGLYRYVAQRSLGHQVGLAVLIALATGLALVPIEMQKRLVNEAIGAASLTALARYGTVFVLGGLAVSGLKFVINLYQGVIAEWVLRDFRAQLFDRILQLPVAQLRRTPPAQLVSVVLAEAEDLGAFFGEAFSVPLVSGLMFLAVSVYLASLNLWMLALLALHPIEIWAIPVLQRRVNQLSSDRVVLGRHLSDHLEQSVHRAIDGLGATDMADDVRRFRARLDRIFSTRIRLYRFKYLIKLVGNEVARLGPFLLFLVGGWLIIARPGSLDLGRLVAALAAYDRLNEAWQELLDYYSLREIATTRYSQIIETVTRQEP